MRGAVASGLLKAQFVIQDKTKTTVTSLYTLTKAAAFGALLCEAWYCGRAFRTSLSASIAHVGLHRWELSAGLVGLVVLVSFLCTQEFLKSLMMVVRSARFDLLFVAGFGMLTSIAAGGIGSQWYRKWAGDIPPTLLGMSVLVPFAIFFGSLLGKATRWIKRRKHGIHPFFLNDEALRNTSLDLLGTAEQAKRFAERVLNNDSPQNMVFGIDAPWGIGKSTFINFCKGHWQASQRSKVILYEFNPLRYEGTANLAETFIDGLIRVIQRHRYIPELRGLVSRYSRFVKGAKTKLSVFDLELPSGEYNIDDAHDDLESVLSRLDAKLIVIIDDLDRLTLTAAKEVLHTIKKSFALPNVSYVLAYDTGNIGALDTGRPDADKLTEFLEKFINVKVSIYLESETLVRYISDNLAAVLSGNSQADPRLVSLAVGGLVEILKSTNYHRYQPLIGDIRKIKRLINTLLLLEIEQVDFRDSDFSPEDLIRLLLIYINYPSVFRKIYDSETGGRMGSFSVLGPHDDNYPTAPEPHTTGSRTPETYKNSQWYEQYRETLRESQQFLVDSVFRASARLRTDVVGRVDESVKRSYACFNGASGSSRNLEQYLHLIVRLSKPQNETQYKFYLNRKNEIKDGVPIEEVLSRHRDFAPTKSERNRDQLWRVIVNSAHEFVGPIGKGLIRHLMENIPDYCLLEDPGLGLGLRDSLPLYLLKLLDTVGWQDNTGAQRNNSNENLREIAEWILGEGPYENIGVIDTLAMETRGVLGLHDLMMFRLHCSADRGGDTFNVQRALATYGDADGPTEGLLTAIAIGEMRKISQHVYRNFERQYIRERVNIFAVIDQLTLQALCGIYYVLVDAERAKGDVGDLEARVAALKSRLKGFIVYQLGNARVNFGVGCGYYDPEGKGDQHKISDLMNQYLFNICFNPVEAENNYEHFVDYLLINFASTLEGQRRYIPTIEEFTKVLQREKLAEYWRAHREPIRARNFTDRDKIVRMGNFSTSYTELDEVYEVLDTLTGGVEPPATTV